MSRRAASALAVVLALLLVADASAQPEPAPVPVGSPPGSRSAAVAPREGARRSGRRRSRAASRRSSSTSTRRRSRASSASRGPTAASAPASSSSRTSTSRPRCTSSISVATSASSSRAASRPPPRSSPGTRSTTSRSSSSTSRRDAAPLVPRWNIAIGAPILAIGNPYGDLPRFSRELEGLLNFSVSQGIVSAKTDALHPDRRRALARQLRRPDALVRRARGRRRRQAPRGAHRLRRAGRPPHEPRRPDRQAASTSGSWTGRDSAIGIAWNIDTATYFGPYIGGSLVGYDRVSITTRLGILFAGKGDDGRARRRSLGPPHLRRARRSATACSSSRTRSRRYFTVGAGILGTFDRGEETRLGATLGPPGCAGSACVATLAATSSAIRGGGVEPLGNAVLHLGGLEASYGYALDVLHPDYSTHRVLVGLSF